MLGITAQQAARMMGDNFISVDEMESLLAYHFEPWRLKALEYPKIEAATLNMYKNTHILVPTSPASISHLKRDLPRIFLSGETPSWYCDEYFAQKTEEITRWQLIRKEPHPKSFGKILLEEVELLGPHERVPYAREVVPAMAAYFLKTGEKLFNETWVRCADEPLLGLRVSVCFDRDGITIGTAFNRWGKEFLGIASSIPC